MPGFSGGDMSARMLSGELLLWGCFEGGALAGVIALRAPCHISLLFVAGDRHRRGIARALMNEAAHYARLNGRKTLTVNSSPYALEAYRRLGFRDTAPEKTVNGIRFTPMNREM